MADVSLRDIKTPKQRMKASINNSNLLYARNNKKEVA